MRRLSVVAIFLSACYIPARSMRCAVAETEYDHACESAVPPLDPDQCETMALASLYQTLQGDPPEQAAWNDLLLSVAANGGRLSSASLDQQGGGFEPHGWLPDDTYFGLISAKVNNGKADGPSLPAWSNCTGRAAP